MKEVHDPDFRLARADFAPHVAVGELGLDLTPSKHPLKLGAYLTEPTTELPAAVTREHRGFQWPMLANNRLGDCVIAMMLHSVQDFALDSGRTPPDFQDQDAIDLYSAIAGYNPQDPYDTDHGTNMDTALEYWKNTGLNGHRIVTSVEINPLNLQEMHVGVYEFVDVQIAVALPLTAKGQYSWQVVGNPQYDPNARPGSWGGHGIPIREYDPTGFKVVTWGNELVASNDFILDYCVQAFVVLTEDMLNNSGVSPTGLAWDDLVSDIKKL